MDLFGDEYIRRDELGNARTKPSSDTFNVVRPVLVQEEVDRQADYQKPSKTVAEKCSSMFRSCGIGNCFQNVLPITGWLREYSIKNDLLGDIVAGCTVTSVHIPQGMAYALLASVPPVVGLYMAFFPVIVYCFLGTSRHISMGTFAVACLMTGKAILKYSDIDLPHFPNGTLIEDGLPEGVPHYAVMEVATAVCFLVGIFQFVMWIFRLGVLSSLLSEPLVSGFITGTTVLVMTSQLKDVFGVTIPKIRGNHEIVLTIYNVCLQLPHANMAAIIISFISITVMSMNNELLKPIVSRVSKIPIPIELIVVITGTLVSKYCDLKGLYGVQLVGDIPTGLPYPKVPPMELLTTVAFDSFAITLVSYTITMSMALIFATKEKYEIDANQELLAMGLGNVFASFFTCVPVCASLSRSSIQYTTGGRTQITSMVSCGLFICVMLWIGPFFEPLPRSILASVIIVALKNLLFQGKDVIRYWKLSKLDGFVWILTFVLVVGVNIDIGLLVGIIVSIGTLFIKAQSPYTCLLGCIPNTEIYLDNKRYKAATEIPGIKIYHYCGGLNFASKNSFKERMFRVVGLPSVSELKALKKAKKMTEEQNAHEYTNGDSNKIKYIIMDLTAMCYMDTGGVGMIRSIYREVEQMGIKMLFSRANGPILEILQKFNKLESETEKLQFTIFPSIHDAVLFAKSQMQPAKPSANTVHIRSGDPTRWNQPRQLPSSFHPPPPSNPNLHTYMRYTEDRVF